jgi:hypothetical protein
MNWISIIFFLVELRMICPSRLNIQPMGIEREDNGEIQKINWNISMFIYP